MKVAYVFISTRGAYYKLGQMILPQLEAGTHGGDVGVMFFFDDNSYILRKGDPIGERLAKIAKQKGIELWVCDMCALDRGLAEGEPVWCQPDRFSPRPGGPERGKIQLRDTIDGVKVGCFPDLYAAAGRTGVHAVISL
jgi:hypothetical protein